MHKQGLSKPRQDLIELCQRLNFGRIEGLAIRSGEPVLDPPPRQIREVKFGALNGPRPEAAKGDFPLKSAVRELFAHMEAMDEGLIHCIEIRHGLPFRMIVEEVRA